jgi:N-acetyl-gamma-glutamyl-phosphate reductase
MRKVKAVIVGAGGYGGCGATELLVAHPSVDLVALLDTQDVGKPMSDLYPHLRGFCDLTIMAPDDPRAPRDADVVFFATPDGVGQANAAKWLQQGAKVIDYSGDFRFNDPDVYKGYAQRIGRQSDHVSPALLPSAVYGLSELHRKEIAAAKLVGNPGCFAVSVILGLAPALKHKLVDPDSIICDGKTGVSGAGKKPNATFHYPARYDAMNAYKVSGHQHVYEIERELTLVAGQGIRVTFTPHVVPVARGILSTVYAKLAAGQTAATLEDAYRAFYKGEPFVRVLGPGKPAISTDVRGSNFCNLSVNVDPRTGTMIVVSLIDNLVKGQAGSAVQNMNILFGLDETAGLLRPGQYP